MSEASGAAAFSPLDRHRSRRLRGIPTVTVLLGEPEVAEWLWESWQQGSGRANVSVACTTASELMGGWLTDERVRSRIGDRVRARVAESLGISAAECSARIAAQSSWQFDDLLASLVPVLGCSAEVLASTFEERATPISALGSAADFAWVVSQLGDTSPGLLLRDSPASNAFSDNLIRVLAGIAEVAPHLDFGVAAGPSLLLAGSESVQREVALLREGVLRVDSISTEPAPTTSEPLLSFDRAEFARSRAERALYRRLESRPTTRGLFVLNARLDERFGSAALEVDLLSERLRVALEVDGYHHFRDSTSYRRDRRKDLLLQELGYLVVRVLASDIADEPEHVLELIDRAVARQTERSA
jgi:very-short-patch-repair endonuclease